MTASVDTKEALRSLLDNSERLLWAGRPKQGVVFHGVDIFLIPFSLVWTGGVLLAFTASIFSDNGTNTLVSIVIFGLMFAIGLYFVAGRFWFDSRRRKKTIYGVTNERVMIQSGVFRRRLKSLNLRTLSDITLDEKRNGEGTLFLGPQSASDVWHRSFSWPGASYSTPTFEGIHDAKQVFDILRQAQKEN